MSGYVYKELECIFEEMGYIQTVQEKFDRLLNACLFIYRFNPTKEEQKEFIDTVQGTNGQLYIKAMQLIFNDSEGMHDAIGDFFQSIISRHSNSQFFTPECVSDLSALVVMGKNNIKEGMSVCDPSVGSGRMLLSAAKFAGKDKHKLHYYGVDIDLRCIKIALLNLCMHSLRGELVWGDSLALTCNKSFYFDNVRMTDGMIATLWTTRNTTHLFDRYNKVVCNKMTEVEKIKTKQEYQQLTLF